MRFPHEHIPDDPAEVAAGKYLYFFEETYFLGVSEGVPCAIFHEWHECMVRVCLPQ